MWGNAMSIADHKVETFSKDITLRYPVYAPFNGSHIKITFDNTCGTEPITISRSSIAVAANDRDIQTETLASVTFDSKESVCIPAGARCVSDSVAFDVKAGSTLSVSFYLGDFTQMRSATVVTGPLSKGFYSVGDVSHQQSLPLKTTRSTNTFYFLNTIDILTEETNRAVICYGDSITAQDWPDYLSLALKEQQITNTAIIRRAASGTRILREYDNITYESYGLMGKHRIPSELNVLGADTIIIQQGINDIIHPVGVDVNPFRPMSDLPTIDEMIGGIEYYVNHCREHSYKVYLGTLLPIFGWRTYAPFREELKNEFNAYLRKCPIADGCIDFDAVVRDESKPEAFADGYDSGDHLHPSAAAYQAMGNAACQFLLQKEPG